MDNSFCNAERVGPERQAAGRGFAEVLTFSQYHDDGSTWWRGKVDLKKWTDPREPGVRLADP